jgi:hypothetical protein
MRAQVFIDQTEGGLVEVSVVKDGLSSGAARKYIAVGEAKAVLLAFGYDAGLIDHQLGVLAGTPPSVLLRFPVADIADDVLRSLGFMAAAFKAA